MLNRRILSGQAKRIPAHGLQYLFAIEPLKTSNNITQCVGSNMPHMELSAGIREHRQAVKLFLTGLLDDFIGFL